MLQLELLLQRLCFKQNLLDKQHVNWNRFFVYRMFIKCSWKEVYWELWKTRLLYLWVY